MTNMLILNVCFWVKLYTAKLLFQQSPTMHSDYTVTGTGQRRCGVVTVVYCWQHGDDHKVDHMLPTVVKSGYTVTDQSLCIHWAKEITDGIGILLCSFDWMVMPDFKFLVSEHTSWFVCWPSFILIVWLDIPRSDTAKKSSLVIFSRHRVKSS